MKGTVRERLTGRLVPCADPECDCSGCLLWTGCINSKGYGVIGVDGARKLVHRVAWSLDNGPVPDGLTIDHVHKRGCRHKTCGNVAHLEPVTRKVNTHRYLALKGFSGPHWERQVELRRRYRAELAAKRHAAATT